MRRPSSVRNAAGCYGIGLTPLDSTGGRKEQMGLAVYREPLLRGERKDVPQACPAALPEAEIVNKKYM